MIQYVVDYALYPNPTDFKTLEPFLDQMTVLDKFDKIVADAGYGSEYNYSMLEGKHLDKKYFISFNFKYHSQRKDRSTSQVRDFKVYEADEFQLTPERLADANVRYAITLTSNI